MALDLVFIALVSQAGGVMLGLAMALGLLRLATRKRENDPFRKLFRLSLGCVGAFALFVTVLVVAGSGIFSDDDPDITGTLNLSTGDDGTASATLGVGDLLSGLGDMTSLATADSEEAAVELATSLGRRLLDGGMSRREVEDVLADAVPGDEEWAAGVPALVMARLDEAEAAEPAEAPAEGSFAAALSELSTGEVVERYAELLDEGGEAPASPEADAVRARLLSELAADSFGELGERIEDLEEHVDDERARVRRLRQELAEAEEVGVVEAFVRFIADDLGLAFGWGTVYLSVFLAWWNGRTPGKKLVGIRVQRLDGGPITGWIAFERAGGYAAGFATGLLGFAQVFWDPNRQGIHDKIVGTVVVREGRSPVPGPWHKEAGGGEPG